MEKPIGVASQKSQVVEAIGLGIGVTKLKAVEKASENNHPKYRLISNIDIILQIDINKEGL